jgi:hypothetical protein
LFMLAAMVALSACVAAHGETSLRDVKFLILEGGGVKGIATGGVFQVRRRPPLLPVVTLSERRHNRR